MSVDSKESPIPKNPVKVVLRHLPKHMTEKEVLEQISPLPEEVIQTYFHPANHSFDSAAYATLTLVFSDYCESMMDFERRFDGYIFVDSRGNDSSAVVEAAVNQEFATCDRERMKKDTRVGVIESDKYYLEFCKRLEEELAMPILTLEQQIRKLNQPEDAKTQLGRLETPLVRFFMKKTAERERDYEIRKQKRDERREVKKAEKKNVLDILMKPKESKEGGPPPRAGKKPLTEQQEKEKYERIEAKKKERNALRKQKFMDEKKKKKEEADALLAGNGTTTKPIRNLKEKKKDRKPNRPQPAKTLGEQQGEDWIKKLTDPKTEPIKKKHDLTESVEIPKKDGNKQQRTAKSSAIPPPPSTRQNAPKPKQSKRPSTAAPPKK